MSWSIEEALPSRSSAAASVYLKHKNLQLSSNMRIIITNKTIKIFFMLDSDYWKNRIEIKVPLTIRDKLVNFGLALYRAGKNGMGNAEVASEKVLEHALPEFTVFLHQLKPSAKKYLLNTKTTKTYFFTLQQVLDDLQIGTRCADFASFYIETFLTDPNLQDFLDTLLQNALRTAIVTIQTNSQEDTSNPNTHSKSVTKQKISLVDKKNIANFPQKKINRHAIPTYYSAAPAQTHPSITADFWLRTAQFFLCVGGALAVIAVLSSPPIVASLGITQVLGLAVVDIAATTTFGAIVSTLVSLCIFGTRQSVDHRDTRKLDLKPTFRV